MSEKRTVKRQGPTIDSIPLIYRHKIPISKTHRFWQGLAEGRIRATRCGTCGSIYFPPQDDCPRCMASGLEWVDLPKRGTIEAFTKVYARPQGYEHFDPYIVAIVGVGDARIIGWLMGVEDERNVRVGMDVEVDVVEVGPGKLVPVFRPA